jgi:hypothetical protein
MIADGLISTPEENLTRDQVWQPWNDWFLLLGMCPTT